MHPADRWKCSSFLRLVLYRISELKPENIKKIIGCEFEIDLMDQLVTSFQKLERTYANKLITIGESKRSIL